MTGRRPKRRSSPKDTEDATTFKVGVIAELFQGFSPFVSYSESFTPLFGGDFYGNPYKPQEGRQYEGGIKWQPLPNSLITATYFDIEDSNFLSTDPDNLQNFMQCGEIGSKGVELEAIVNLDIGLSVKPTGAIPRPRFSEGTARCIPPAIASRTCRLIWPRCGSARCST